MDVLAIASKAVNSVHGFSFLLFIVIIYTLQLLRDSQLIGFKLTNSGFLGRRFLNVAAFSENGLVGVADFSNGGYAKNVRRFHHEREQ